jgi:hypothetical protein
MHRWHIKGDVRVDSAALIECNDRSRGLIPPGEAEPAATVIAAALKNRQWSFRTSRLTPTFSPDPAIVARSHRSATKRPILDRSRTNGSRHD